MNNLEQLKELKRKRSHIWEVNAWCYLNFSQEDKKEEKELTEIIESIENNGILLKCTECGVVDKTVDFKSESPRKVICDDCWDEIRDEIRDKYGL
jgi:hypothetical protein